MVEYAPMRTSAENQHPRGRRCVRFGASAGLTCVFSLALLGLTGSAATAQTPAAPAATPAVTAQETDAVSELIALSTRHFEAGQRELRDGHLDMAKAEF